MDYFWKLMSYSCGLCRELYVNYFHTVGAIHTKQRLSQEGAPQTIWSEGITFFFPICQKNSVLVKQISRKEKDIQNRSPWILWLYQIARRVSKHLFLICYLRLTTFYKPALLHGLHFANHHLILTICLYK